MKLLFFSSLAGLATLLAGCSSGGNPQLALPMAGPSPAQAVSKDSANGTLVVYSAFEAGASFNSRNRTGQAYSSYKIFAADGELLQRVSNDSGDMAEEPVPVNLPAGTYSVVARANGYGMIKVPVLIVAGQNTVLHLEGGLPENKDDQQSNHIHLPDGRAIGYRAPTN